MKTEQITQITVKNSHGECQIYIHKNDIQKTLQNRKEILNAAREIKNVYLHLPFSILSVTNHTHSKTARSQIEINKLYKRNRQVRLYNILVMDEQKKIIKRSAEQNKVYLTAVG